jgi:tetratricopeptide (TPR) repeat protein
MATREDGIEELAPMGQANCGDRDVATGRKVEGMTGKSTAVSGGRVTLPAEETERGSRSIAVADELAKTLADRGEASLLAPTLPVADAGRKPMPPEATDDPAACIAPTIPETPRTVGSTAPEHTRSDAERTLDRRKTDDPGLGEDSTLADTSSDPAPRPRPVLPGYEILGDLGRGGMGIVYLARQTRLDRLCALKMILGGAHASDQTTRRFLQEAQTVARLHHPNVAQIYHIGDHEGNVYIELEYAEGGSLEKRLDGTPWPWRKAAELVLAAARGAAEAHHLGVVHRDLKPANVLLTADGTPKISDFGLAKILNAEMGLTQTESILGSPSYMAPEQAEGKAKEVGKAADVYALGAVLYELLTGRPPFNAASILETLEQVKSTEAISPCRLQPGLPRDVDTICMVCLRKEPWRRYPDAGALADDLQRLLNGEDIQARRSGPARQAWRWCRRHPSIAGLLATLVAVMTGGILALTLLWLRAERLRAESEASFLQARQAVDDYLTRVAQSRLLGVPGLQPLRAELLESALKYYEGFASRRAADPSLREELESAYARVGKIHAELGRRDEALDAYHKALDLQQRRAKQSKDRDDVVRGQIAQTRQEMGDVLFRLGNRRAALEAYEEARKLRVDLVAPGSTPGPSSPVPGGAPAAPGRGTPEAREALAVLLDRMGDVYRQSNDLTRALQFHGEALMIEWQLVHGNPRPSNPNRSMLYLARMFSKLGELQVDFHMDAGAFRWVVGNAIIDAADLGTPSTAQLAFYRRALSILDEMPRQASDAQYTGDVQRELAHCHEQIAQALIRQDQAEDALKSYGQAQAIRRRLTKENPAVTEYHEDLARVDFELGRLHAARQDWAAAGDALRDAVDHEEVVVSTTTGSTTALRTLASHLSLLATAEHRSGRDPQALDHCLEACRLLQTIPELTGNDHYELARAHAVCAALVSQGRPQLTTAERERAERETGSAVASLARAIDSGFEDYDRASKDEGLNSVRSREDFKLQMARLKEIGRGVVFVQDMEAARRQAASQGKDLLLYFSGSDWCPWCTVLKKTVFDQPAFARYANRHFVMVLLDNPQRTAPPENRATVDGLSSKWQVYAVPTVILADAQGRPYALVVNEAREQNAQTYIETLEKLRPIRRARDESLALAATTEGLDRVRNLDQALGQMKTLQRGILAAEYSEICTQILALDPDNRAGLRARYADIPEAARTVRLRQADQFSKDKDWSGALKQYDAILSGLKPAGLAEQEVVVGRVLALRALDRMDEARAEEARAVALGGKVLDERRAKFGENPRDPDRRKSLSDAYRKQISALQKLGRKAEAIAAAHRRKELWPGHPEELYDVACELALCQNAQAPGGSKAPADKKADRQVGDQAMEVLRLAVLAGFKDASHMSRDPDLEPLRPRDDFRRLVRSVQELGGLSTRVSELCRLLGPGPAEVKGIATAPDGRYAVSAGLDKTVRVWDLSSAREIRHMEAVGQLVALAVSPDGRRALTGGLEKTLQLWDLETGLELKRLVIDKSINALAISPGGTFGLAGINDGSIRVIDMGSLRETRILTGHTAAVRSLAITRDGRRALSGGADATVRLWDLESGRELQRLGEHHDTVWSVSISPDDTMALAGGDDGILWLLQLDGSRAAHRLADCGTSIRATAFSGDGRLVLSADMSRKLTMWERETGQLHLGLVADSSLIAAIPVGDGTRALSADSQGVVQLWTLDPRLIRLEELDLTGRWTEAGLELEESLLSRPRDPRLWILKGRHETLLGRWDQATAAYRKAIDSAGGSAQVLDLVADSLRVDRPRGDGGAQSLIDLLSSEGPRSVALWLKPTQPTLGIEVELSKEGARLVGFTPQSPAQRAGFRVGDVITEIAGKRVTDSTSFGEALGPHRPGDSVLVNSRRLAGSLSRDVTLGNKTVPSRFRQDLAREELDTQHRHALDGGYRPVYLTTHVGRRRDFRHAALWVQDGVPFRALYDGDLESLRRHRKELPAGYRPAWLAATGDAGSRRWSAIWIQDNSRIPWQEHDDLDQAELATRIDQLAGQGYRPIILVPYPGADGTTRYSGVWIKDGKPFRAKLHATTAELENSLNTLSSDWRPDWVGVSKEHGIRDYVVIFIQDPGTEWRLTFDTPEWGMQSVYNRLNQEEFAPVLLDLE